MGDTIGALVAIGITVPLMVLLIYFGFRNFFASIRNVKAAIDEEVGRRRGIDAGKLRDTESMVSRADPAVAAAIGPRQPAPKPNETPPSAAVPLPTNPSEMAAHFQETAKKSDDEHKARIRAHVERPVPPITAAGEEAIRRARAATLAIKHVFPPRLPQRSMSYLGGLPIVPPKFEWPKIHNREGLLEGLNFLAQIDCSDLPPGPCRDLLPGKGYLYFFAPMSDSFGPDAMHFVTRYQPGPATAKWEPLEGMFTAKLMRNDAMDRNWSGKGYYDRIEIDFGWIEEPTDDEVAERSDEGYPHEVADKIRAEKLDAFFGPPVPYDPLLSAHDKPKDALWEPYEGFPANWRTARILRMLVEAYHREEMEDVEQKLEELGEVGDEHPEAQQLQGLKRDLMVFGSKMSSAFFPTIHAGMKDHDAPPDEVKQQIMAFLEFLRASGMPSSKERPHIHLRLPLVINRWLEIAAIHGAEQALSEPDGAPLIPPEVVSALAYRHADRKHQMMGEGEVVQVAADEMKDRFILLLQLGPDKALDWLIGEMGPLQYWITPEDLAAKRFENTVLTIEAY